MIAEPVQLDAGAAAVMAITENNEEPKGEDESYSMIESFVQDTSVLNQSQVNDQKWFWSYIPEEVVNSIRLYQNYLNTYFQIQIANI